MKKLLIGCLVILALGAGLLGVGAYFLYRAASPVIDSARNVLGGFSQVAELEKEIRNQSAFNAPEHGELVKEQVDRFARVQESVRKALGQRIQEIEAKYEYLRSSSPEKQPSFVELMNSLREMTGMVVDARRAQVNALNQEGFSSSEYAWVRSRIYQAAGVELAGALDLPKIIEAVRQGTGSEDIRVPDTPIADVPARNRELVKPFAKQIDQWLPLAFFGL